MTWKLAKTSDIAHYVDANGVPACGFLCRDMKWRKDADITRDKQCKKCKEVMQWLKK
jgi:hypothetical protein